MIDKTISDCIREAQKELGFDCTNKQIQRYCQEHYGKKPISQTINSAIGTEYSRQANQLTANQLADTKRFIKKHFNNDANALFSCINLINGIKKA
jgi:hypothetical protein